MTKRHAEAEKAWLDALNHLVECERQWVATQTAKGKSPWTDREYCAEWLQDYRENPLRDYHAWHREQTG